MSNIPIKGATKESLLRYYLGKTVKVHRQGLKNDFIGVVTEVKIYSFVDLPGAEVVNEEGKKMLVFNLNHISVYKHEYI